MKIAISAKAPSLDADVDPRFGRCQYFIIVDPDTLDFEAVENASQIASGGAGIASAQAVASKEVQAVLTGNCGPNAYQTLEAAEIAVITGVSGTVRDAIEGYKTGRFRPISEPSVDAHHGMGGSTGPGMGGGRAMGGGMSMGRGIGRGMGMGRGTGMGPGMGMGRGTGMGPAGGVGPDMLTQEFEALKTQTQMMGQQLSEIMRRLDDLERNSA